MAKKSWYADKSGRRSKHPPSRELAIELKLARWQDWDGCDKCGSTRSGTIRYTSTNECAHCIRVKHLRGDDGKLYTPIGEPVSVSEALAQNKPYYCELGSFMFMCPNGPHLLKRDLASGRCITCRSTKKQNIEDLAPDAIISRDAAIMLGLKMYRTGKPCRRGHKSFRFVANNGCSACKRGES